MNNNTKPKMSDNRKKKELLIAGLSTKVSKAKGFVFANYQGMTHQQLEQLKKGLRTVEAEIVVSKNTLLSRSLKENKIEAPLFQGPTLALFAYNDVITPIKELAKIIKQFNLPIIKLGIIEGKHLQSDDIIRLSTLPSKEILIAQMLSGMKSPLYGLHRALNWNLQKFVMTLKAIEQKKS